MYDGIYRVANRNTVTGAVDNADADAHSDAIGISQYLTYSNTGGTPQHRTKRITFYIAF